MPRVSIPLPSSRRAGSPLLVLGLSLVLLTGCLVAPPLGDGEAEEAETVGASLCLQVADMSSPEAALSDVQALKASIQDATTQTGLLVNVDLLKAPAPATGWCSAIPALPRGKRLVFSVTAYSSKTLQSADILFFGTTTQILTARDSRILVTLSPLPQGGGFSPPRIVLISTPSAFVSPQSNTIRFAVEGANGATLSYAVTVAGSQGSGGAFYPSTGALTLSATAGIFVSQYAPPLVSTDTVFEHSLTVTNAAGHSVTLPFKTTVKPPGKWDQVNHVSLSLQDSDVHAPSASLSEVRAIKVSVRDATTDTALLVNVDLLKATAPATGWSGTLSALPRDRPLLFLVAAYSSTTVQPDHLLFTGITPQTLTADNPFVPVALYPTGKRRDEGEDVPTARGDEP